MSKKAKQPKPAPVAETGELAQQEHAVAEDAASSLTIYGDNPNALVLPDTMPEADYLAYGARIGAAYTFASWRVGDWVNFGVTKYGYKDYEKIAGVTGLSEQYLRACSSVAKRIAPTFRGMHSMEKFRLMLARQDEGEKIEHLVKRLGHKTQSQLKEMAGAGKAGRTDTALTATELKEMFVRIIAQVPQWDDTKITVFTGINSKADELSQVRKILDQLAGFVEDKQAEADAKADEAKAAANKAHDAGEMKVKPF